ncbi:MAG: hypothetical protein CL942_09210 [Desulfovibrio sp.]|nr:hypothetical protein [Desulfovibrio sp.]|tara:strand:+ start:559 stop:909 length:351 start_codon:yes stop_codon:yes gene_type:complete
MERNSQDKDNGLRPLNMTLLIIGMILIWLGIRGLEDPLLQAKGVMIDISPFQTPFAIAAIGVGIFSMWSSFARSSPSTDDLLACPQCEKQFTQNDVENGQCPICLGEVEPVDNPNE